MAHIHHVPGRLRIRISVVKRNPALASAVEQQIASLPGVRRSEANPLTGSVVVLYDPAVTSASALISAVKASGYHLDESRPELVRTPAVRNVPGASQKFAQKAGGKNRLVRD